MKNVAPSDWLHTVITRKAGLHLAACVSCAMLAASLGAQRPAPPKGWTIDTTGDRPIATRKGGMMSSDSRAEVVGPMAWTGTILTEWLRTYAHDDAGALGVLVPPSGNPVSVSTIAGQQIAVAAYSVKAAAGTLYLTYSTPSATPAGQPVIVIRSTFSEPLTMVRAFRTSVEAVLPYLLTPTPQMRALAVAAAPAAVPTSFRTTVPRPDASAASGPVSDSTVGDTAVTSAVRAGVNDAIALLGADTSAAAAQTAASAPPGRQSTPRQTTSATPARTGAVSEANVELVVFYQWGDLQYRPVALFKDGTAFDLDDDAIDVMNVARSRAEHPGQWGRWRHVGAKYFLTDGSNGRVSDWTLGSGFYTAFPAPQAGTLTGRYKSVSGSTMGETSTLLTSTLSFRPDGRFTNGTVFAATGSGEMTGVSMAGGAVKSAGGRYRISQYHIELIYDDGHTKQYFFGFGSSGTPARIDRDMIFIGDTAYVLDTP